MQYEEGNISPLRAFLKKKWVRIVLSIDVLALLAAVGFIIYNAAKNSRIVFNVAPIDASISVNGKSGYESGTYAFLPGTYEITLSHDGMESKTFTIDLASHDVATITTFLADSDHSFEFYELKDHQASMQVLQQIASADHNITTDGDASAQSFISTMKSKLSIMDLLPIKGYIHAQPGVGASTAGFTIRDGRGEEKCEVITCLLVNYYGQGYETEVMKTIEGAKYNPADYQIVYERYN